MVRTLPSWYFGRCALVFWELRLVSFAQKTNADRLFYQAGILA